MNAEKLAIFINKYHYYIFFVALNFITYIHSSLILHLHFPRMFIPSVGLSIGYYFAFRKKAILPIFTSSIFSVCVLISFRHIYAGALELFIFAIIGATLITLPALLIERGFEKLNANDFKKLTIVEKFRFCTIVTLIVTLIPGAIGPLFSMYGNEIFEKSILYRVIYGVVDSINSLILFGPITYVIFKDLSTTYRKVFNWRYFTAIVIVLFQAVVFMEMNNKINVDQKITKTTNQIAGAFSKTLEHQISLLYFISQTAKLHNYDHTMGLEELKRIRKSISGHWKKNHFTSFAIYSKKTDHYDFNLVKEIMFEEDVHKYIEKWQLPKKDIRTRRRVSDRVPFLYSHINLVKNKKSKLSFGMPIPHLSNGENQYVLFATIRMDEFLQAALLPTKSKNKSIETLNFSLQINSTGHWQEIYNMISKYKLLSSKSELFKYSSEFESFRSKFKITTTPSIVSYIAMASPSRWFHFLALIITCMVIFELYIGMTSKDLKINETLISLESQNKAKEIAEQKLKTLNENLEKEVIVRTSQVIESVKEKQSILNAFPDVIFKIDQSGNVLSKHIGGTTNQINRVFTQGITNVSQFLSNRQYQKYLAKINECITTNKVTKFNYSFPINNITYFFEARLSKINEQSVISVVRDTTDLIMLENKLKEQNLKALQNSKLASLGEMAGGIAHEINNPLAIISGSADLLSILDKKGQLSDPRASMSVSRIQKTVSRIAKIINGLKKYSHKQSIEKVYINTNEFIEDFMSFCFERFKASNVKLNVNNQLKSNSILCNQVDISQVMVNLLNNAFDAVQTLNEKWVNVILIEDDESIFIKIIDSGKTIPKSLANKILEPFFTTKQFGKGTGLGLSISKTIVDAHGGELYIDSNSVNACFVVKLPKVEPKTNVSESIA